MFGLFKFLLRPPSARTISRRIARRAFRELTGTTYTPQIKPAQNKIDVAALPSHKIKWVVDGDTIIIAKFFGDEKIRLDAIDAPELGQHWGDVAKAGLIKMTKRRRLRFEMHGRDKFGRTIATLYVWDWGKNTWLNVNERMIMLGHAWAMHSHMSHLPVARQQKLQQLQRWARNKKIGLWKNDSAIPPWQWRASN